MESVVKWIDNNLYSAYADNWDDWLFRERILAYLTSESVALDLGAGAGLVKQMNFKGVAKKICGVDLDPRVKGNPFLDEARVSDAGEIPYRENIFDVAFSDNVLEHIQDPLRVFKEVRRVLKPGGVFLFKTPNKWHYMPLIARMTPHRFHQYVNRLRGRAAEDTFPTFYRCNTRRDVERLAIEAGLRVVSIKRIEGRPEYLRMSWPTYLAGLIYERIVNSTHILEPFRVLLIGELRKPV